MRLFLLPLTPTRTLLYCHRLNNITSASPTYVDRATTRAATLWTKWEQGDRKWQKTLTAYGNKALARIPYEEWGLKSVPPLSTRRHDAELAELRESETIAHGKVPVVFPASILPSNRVHAVLRTLATERQTLHRRRMYWCIVGMPISAPVALLPVIPNVPFFYLLFRAWSHWRALSGSKHIAHLLDRDLLALEPSDKLDTVYAAASPATAASPDQHLLLGPDPATAASIASTLAVPELGLEIERALRQVAHRLEDEADAEGAPTNTTTAAESQTREGRAPKLESNELSDKAATHSQEEARIRDDEARASAATGGRTGAEEGIKR